MELSEWKEVPIDSTRRNGDFLIKTFNIQVDECKYLVQIIWMVSAVWAVIKLHALHPTEPRIIFTYTLAKVDMVRGRFRVDFSVGKQDFIVYIYPDETEEDLKAVYAIQTNDDDDEEVR